MISISSNNCFSSSDLCEICLFRDRWFGQFSIYVFSDIFFWFFANVSYLENREAKMLDLQTRKEENSNVFVLIQFKWECTQYCFLKTFLVSLSIKPNPSSNSRNLNLLSQTQLPLVWIVQSLFPLFSYTWFKTKLKPFVFFIYKYDPF